MNLYVETSALAAWILGEEDGRLVEGLLGDADRVQSSELTFVEVERLLTRREATEELDIAGAAAARDRLLATAAAWEVMALGPDVLERACRRFPAEPVRTLDAIHLASALAGRAMLPDAAFLSLDRRCRLNAGRLGFRVLPEPAGELREESEAYGAARASADRGSPRVRSRLAGLPKSPTAKSSRPRRRA